MTKTDALLMQDFRPQVAATLLILSTWLCAQEEMWVGVVISDVAFYFGADEVGNNNFKDDTIASFKMTFMKGEKKKKAR